MLANIRASVLQGYILLLNAIEVTESFQNLFETFQNWFKLMNRNIYKDWATCVLEREYGALGNSCYFISAPIDRNTEHEHSISMAMVYT